MKTIILCAGKGSRLQPLTNDKPKCLVEILGEPLLSFQMKILKDEGINDVVIVRGYMADSFNYNNVRYYTNDEFENTNMLFSLYCARQELYGELIISYGDIVYSKEILKQMISSESKISVAVDLDWRNYWENRFSNPLDDAESLKIGENGGIIEIGQKTNSYDNIQGQYIGLLRFSKEGTDILRNYIDYLFEDTTFNFRRAYFTDMLNSLLKKEKIEPVFISGGWIEIDTLTDIESDFTVDRLKNIIKL